MAAGAGATLYGSDQSPGRSAALLDPAVDAARRLILSMCKQAARADGFAEVPLIRMGKRL